MEGSSPRMRGSPRGSDARKAQPGIIPAHAGLTLPAAAHRDGSGDHPRACGAHQWKRSSGHRRKGSSPRMRGSPAHAAHGNNHRGIIPAHAGLTSFIFVSPFVIWDHPRACGAHLPQVLPIQVSWGSSPRMRGSQSAKALSCMTRGIIPAHAGLTDAADPCAATTWDHPRACGAHMYILHTWDKTRGSSPRMRGSLRFYPNVASTIGIIPAHAGLTLLQNPNVPNKRDHPRACGAHHIFAHLSATVVGSSPRMRGSR